MLYDQRPNKENVREFETDDELVDAICQMLADHFRLHTRVRHGELVIKISDGKFMFTTLMRHRKPQVSLPA